MLFILVTLYKSYVMLTLTYTVQVHDGEYREVQVQVHNLIQTKITLKHSRVFDLHLEMRNIRCFISSIVLPSKICVTKLLNSLPNLVNISHMLFRSSVPSTFSGSNAIADLTDFSHFTHNVMITFVGHISFSWLSINVLTYGLV